MSAVVQVYNLKVALYLNFFIIFADLKQSRTMYHPSLDPITNYEDLQDLLEQGNAYLDWPTDELFEIKPDISGWSIGFHLYHLAKAHGAIPGLIERLQTGRIGEEGLEGQSDMLELIHRGIVPRGRQAPEMARPPADLTHDLLITDFGRMSRATRRIEPLLDDLESITYSFPHLYYGPLNALEWLRFMHIHTAHHIGIIEEIEAG